MKAKNAKKDKTVKPYANFRPADASFLTKIDNKMVVFRKNNKKYALEFYGNAKNFVLNAIDIKNKHKVGKFEALPKMFLDLINDRDVDKLFNGYRSDTINLGKVLFSDEMTLEEICACAMEYVRICSSNFERFNGESVRGAQSELAESLAQGYNGVLSFYFGVANDVDRGQLLARLINVGLDINHSIAYAECVVDPYGNPLCQIVEFSGKPMLAIKYYNGVAKKYNENVNKLNRMYQFLDFSSHIPLARKRAVKALFKFHNFKAIVPRSSNLEEALISLGKNAVKNLSDLTSSEANLLVKVDKKVFKLSTLIEVALYERQLEYEVIPDLFEDALYAFKVQVQGSKNFKIYPNKFVNESFVLQDARSFILNKKAVTEDIEDVAPTQDFKQVLDAQDEISDYEDGNYIDSSLIENLKPVPASKVLDQMRVKFSPPEGQDEILLDGSRIKVTERQIENAMQTSPLELGEIKEIDLAEAEREQKLYEQEIGELPVELKRSDTTKKRKSFYDALDEIAEKISKNRAKKLQEAYEDMERSGELRTEQSMADEYLSTQQALNEHPNIQQPQTVVENKTEPIQTSSAQKNTAHPIDKNTEMFEHINAEQPVQADKNAQPILMNYNNEKEQNFYIDNVEHNLHADNLNSYAYQNEQYNVNFDAEPVKNQQDKEIAQNNHFDNIADTSNKSASAEHIESKNLSAEPNIKNHTIESTQAISASSTPAQPAKTSKISNDVFVPERKIKEENLNKNKVDKSSKVDDNKPGAINVASNLDNGKEQINKGVEDKGSVAGKNAKAPKLPPRIPKIPKRKA